ncbi:non-ribosomal peptide synthetase [Actinocrispum wychmicini]|uniref:Amino acid adenylation domain-containing protein n=1 Tax=Actinocrispum wychmicini TaxID=1213861 RepID=A0A4R2JFH5_9PSEU|nr:non-ribosomal peptide synthetase [Actinocrispum wychmicini]TCO55608.1 amino acid adenylation domain-containing protein [Actinocrispum wychmicini]
MMTGRTEDLWHAELTGVVLPTGIPRRTDREQQRVTLSGTPAVAEVLTAVEVLLARYCSIDDFVLWVSQSVISDIAQLPVLNESALPMRVRYDGRSRVDMALTALAERVTTMYEHSGVDTSGLPTAGFAFAHDVTPDVELLFTYDPTTGTVTIDGEIEATSLLDSLTALVTELAPDIELTDLPLTSPAERTRILTELAGPATTPQEFVSAHEQIAEQAPESIAIVCGQRHVTYGELNERSNQLAHRLIEAGAGPGSIVALCVSRTPEMVMGMLAAARAGAAYLPMDPGYPSVRLAFMLDDAAPVVVLAERDIELPAADVRIDLDDEWPDRPVTAPPAGTTVDTLAYVIYTSGSTGQPKGVEISAGGLDNLIRWHRETYRLTADDHTTQIAGTAFDATVWEIWPTLTAGATLHLVDENVRSSPAEVVRWLADQRITVSFLPTPLAELALKESWPADCSLRYLLTGGDTLHVRPPAGLPFTFVNHYGPTENSVVATAGVVSSQDTTGRQEPSIGRPITNVQVYLVDERMRPVPVGVPGELYVGGAGVARGYLNRPELTAERFVPNPFGTGKLYRTGDLASWRLDGEINFLGRADDQVQLRGFRVELGEIEAVAATHPGIDSIAVVLRTDTPVLAAYFVAQDGKVNEALLRDWLAARLPEHMVPTVFIELESLPLTRNGKVDRKALPVPDSHDHVEPAPGTEAELASLWADVLGVERVGALDDFLALGGNSLLSGQIVARLPVALPPSSVLAARTVREMAVELDRHGEKQAPLTRVERHDRLPLTAGQRQMWLLDRLDPQGITYNIPLTMDLIGPLQTEKLAHALRGVVARHEALRTTFPTVDGEPVQEIGSAGVNLVIVDEPADEWITTESRRPFDLAKGPLMRASLVRLAPDHHVLLVVVHHIVFDGWSLGVFCRDLAALYEGGSLPDIDIQNADLAVWQATHRTSQASDREFWRKALAGAPPIFELPTDFARRTNPTNAGARRVQTLDAELAARLAQFSRAEGVTVFMTLLAAFNVVLSRYSGATDIVIGSPVAGRVRPELEAPIGCFMNTLPLRTDMSGAPGFRELLRRVRAVSLAAQAHQDLTFAEIVEAVRPDRTTAQSPIFQVMFVLEDAHDAQFTLGDVRATVTEVDFGSTRSELGLSVTEVDGCLRVCAEYRTELYTSDTIDRLLESFSTVLAGALAVPDEPITTLPVLSEAQRHRMLHEWNDTASPFADGAVVHELFERQVDQTPDAVAVVFEDEIQLTYRELDERANQLAHHLRALGVGPESRVGICVHRSPEMVVGMLGVLKAGGGYLPLDPTNPPDRLEFITQDAGAHVVLTQHDVRDRLTGDAVIVELDADWGDCPVTRPGKVNHAHDLAYVIYTSGSTGKPKGVMIEHRSVCNFMATVHGLFEMGSHDNVLQFASLGFDVSVFEIFSALTCGARLCLARQDTLLSVKDLTAFMRRHEVSVMDMPPPVMSLLDGGAFPKLRIAFVGGEAFSGGLVNRWAVPGRRFFNGYGPTEGTVTVIVEECSGTDWQQSPPIGRPMPNMTAYALDRHGQLVPVGVPGELHIGGIGLARGYLNRPELTAERFVRAPFDPAERLYKTGDLVRYLPDGRLDFLGRIDDQVKLRGFRIELGEVETGLRAHPEVVEAAVVLREDQPGRKRLVGYYTPADAAPAELSAFLAERMPSYMVPSALVGVARFPLNASGKIDRKALPAPDAADIAAVKDVVEPRNRRERALAEIWAELLGVPRVGVHDNFFELGGQSILGIQLVWEIHRRMGVDVSIRDVFDRPTVASLAVVVEDAMLALLAEPGLPEKGTR